VSTSGLFLSSIVAVKKISASFCNRRKEKGASAI
jgi:hypothetical protein